MILKRPVLLIAAASAACIRKSFFNWHCDEKSDDESPGPLILRPTISDSSERIHSMSSPSATPDWSDISQARSIALWKQLSSYKNQTVDGEDEFGITRVSSELSMNMIHLQPVALGKTLKLIATLLKLYGPERIVVAFNGGKDATVTLSMYCAALARYGELANVRVKPRAIWFRTDDEFEVVQKFIGEQVAYWDLEMTVVRGGWEQSVDEVVQRYAIDPHPLFLLGVRSSDLPDEGAGVSELMTSNSSKEVYMRAHPILSWRYGMIWEYFRLTSVPYCPLYDMGYTSLGKLAESAPNEHLREVTAGSETTYRPAYELCPNYWTSERSGRLQQKTKENEVEFKCHDSQRTADL